MRRASFALLLVSCAGRPRAVAPVVRVAAPAPAPPAPSPSREAAPAPPSAPVRPGRVVPAPVPVGEGPMGTAHPTWPWMTDPNGRWVVLCQSRSPFRGDEYASAARAAYRVPAPRRPDRMRPYLIVGGGEGVEINDPIAQGGDGRWLVYRRETRVLLRDATDGTEEDLSPRSLDVDRFGRALVPPGVASVAADGRRMAYLRDEGGEVQTVVRDLPGGEPRVLDPVPGEVTGLWISADGAWVVRRVTPLGTDLAGRPIAPPPRTRLTDPDCELVSRARPPSGEVPPRGPVVVAPVMGGAPSAVDGVLGTFGDELLVRRGDALERLGRDGRRTVIAPASCRAALLGRHPTRRVLLLGCTRAGAAPLQVYDPRGMRSLGLRVVAGASDALTPSHVAEVTLPGPRSDAPTRISLDTLRAVPAAEVYLGVEQGSRYLARRGDRLAVRDFGSASRTSLLPRLPGGSEFETWYVERYGRHVLMGEYLVDLWEARVRGPIVTAPLVVTPEGRVLMPSGRYFRQTLMGPFVWQLPPALDEGPRPPPAVPSPPPSSDLDAGGATDASAARDATDDARDICQGDRETAGWAMHYFVQLYLRRIRDCYERAATAHPGVGGRVVLHFAIGPEGHLSEVSVEGLPEAPEVGACIAEVFRPLEYPWTLRCREEFSFPFTFSPGG